MKAFTFSKKERLCSHTLITRLFEGTNSFLSYPFRIVWMDCELPHDSVNAQIAISVSKRNFKKAVDRNKIKRKIREAYRLNKSDFYEYLDIEGRRIAIVLIFLGKELPQYHFLEHKLKKMLRRFIKELAANQNKNSENIC